jgi:hypothetical protein
VFLAFLHCIVAFMYNKLSIIHYTSNSEIPINPAMEESGPETGSFDFNRKSVSSVEQADIRDMFQKFLLECLYINHCGIS